MNDSLPSTPVQSKLNRSGAADQVLADLQERILQGTLARGSKLPSERQLAQRYQVSAPTIREAIRALAAVNLIAVRHGTGMYVTAATDVSFALATTALLELEKVGLLDILDVLEMLYVKIVQLACEHADANDLTALSSALDALEQETSADDIAASLKKFLGLLADASHNALIATLCKCLVTFVIEVAWEEHGGLARNWRMVGRKLRVDRRNLVKSLQARDIAGATAMAARYHRHTKSLVKDLLAADNPDAAASLQRAFRRVRQAAS
jgi:GntR family transcriptional repressor for pyruvate dehydrogenase complex